MNSNQRSEVNNQSNNGGNELDVSSSRAGTVGSDKLNKPAEALPQQHQPNDVAGGLPKSPAGHHLAADRKMDDDTGLSNTANREPVIDDGVRQEQQSNVGRRSDGTPD